MNSIQLMGRITKELEVKTSQSGTTVLPFTVAINRPVPKGANQQTDFINCVAFDKTADMVAKWFGKGRMIAVEGRLQIDSYTDSYGNNKTAAKVIVSRVHFTGEKREDNPQAAPVQGMNPDYAGFVDINDENDLPF